MTLANAIASLPRPEPGLFDTVQAATFLGIEPTTLEVWRCTKRHNIPYIKVGRLCRYRRKDLEDWLASRTIGAAA